jgi:hypothetical protein
MLCHICAQLANTEMSLEWGPTETYRSILGFPGATAKWKIKRTHAFVMCVGRNFSDGIYSKARAVL